MNRQFDPSSRAVNAEPASGTAATNQRVRVLFADQLNLARGKYVPRDFAASGDVRFCQGAFAVTYAKQLVAAPGSGAEKGLPDIEARFDPSAYRKAWEDGTDLAIADLWNSDGTPFGLCGRSALKKAIADWRELGLDPMIGLEGEAYVFERGADGSWVPYNTPGSYVYGTGPFTDPAGLMEDIWRTAEACGLPLESLNAEYDAPQFELTLKYADALKACDDFFLFRIMARERLYKKGYLLSFMPKPIPDLSGTGFHVNMSFKDKAGQNALAGGTGRDALSDLVKGCIAGLIEHHEALGGLLAPTVNSYDRLGPGSLSGYWANWGYDHRGVAVRISAEGGAASRIEHRVADCAASPFVAVAAVLQAARLGVVKKYDLPPAETGDGLETIDTDRCIAENLTESLKLLQGDPALCDAIGRQLVDNFVAIKSAEIEELSGADQQTIFNYYAPYL